MNRFLPFVLLCTAFLAARDRPFHSTPDREKDMLHMSVNIEVNIPDGHIFGSVRHTFMPFASDCRQISIDAERMSIERVVKDGENLEFQQHTDKVWIDLDQAYGWEDTVTVEIYYHVNPTIGFYFVRPDEEYPDKQLQGWTQGEDMDNHFWVPLHDYPNDRMTWECRITVDKPLTAISNGELVSVVDKGNQRTFHWRENIPNVSYLLSVAVGDYKQIEDAWNRIPVNYWVYQHHDRAAALRSFGRTPVMMEFFSDITGVPYPYEKYDQIIIEDFMWGGMENVTNTHQTDRTMHEENVRPIHSSDGLVAHELAHQWYGDYLTTRNWSNVWLNEGFASYLALLWIEHAVGHEEAEYERLKNLGSTIRADRSYRRPTVQPYYYNSIELFDANIYAKGSVILNMVRRYLGDAAFFRGLKYYTRTNAANNVETTDLKKTFEVTTGKNLDWFFEQWVYKPGLPEITARYSYNRRSQLVTLHLKQTQNVTETSLFKLPMTVVIDDGSVQRHEIFFEQEEDTYTFPTNADPLMVIVDEGNQIPKNLIFKKKTNELLYQLRQAPAPNDRVWAAREIGKGRSTKKIHEALISSLSTDPYWFVRREVVKAYEKLTPRNGEVELLANYTGQDDRVKRVIINALAAYETDDVISFLTNSLKTETNDYLISASLSALIDVDLDIAREQFDWSMAQNSHGETIRSTALNILTMEKTDENLNKLKELSIYGNAPYNLRSSIFSSIASYHEDHPDLNDFFAEHLMDKNRNVRWVCAEQIIRRGSADQFAAVLEMADIDPLRGRSVVKIYDSLDERRTNILRKKNRKGLKEVEKMQEMFKQYSADWSNK